MKIAILVEGATEMAFRKKLREFLESRLEQKKPKLNFITQDSPIPKERKLKKIVENLLDNDGYNAVIHLQRFIPESRILKMPRMLKIK
jgi:hypothetical protein